MHTQHVRRHLPADCDTAGSLLRGDFVDVRRYVAASVRPTLRPFSESQMPTSPGKLRGSTCSRHHTPKATHSEAREAYAVSEAPSRPPSMAAAAASKGCRADSYSQDVSMPNHLRLAF
jgi:hypothetical protein